LERQGRGGRRWAFLSLAKEAELLRGWEDRAQQGEVLTAKQFRPWLAQATGRAVSLAYVYGLLHRRRWRKLGPRPRHLKASVRKQEAFEKLSGHLEPSGEESPARKTGALALSGRGPFWPHQ
jgi:hypothetical protein